MPPEGATTADLLDLGVLAYRQKDFPEAIQCLQAILDQDPCHWRAKLYLGMSYYHSGELFIAYGHFRNLLANCNDNELRSKAEAAMQAMSSQVQNRMPEMTCTMKKVDSAVQRMAASVVPQPPSKPASAPPTPAPAPKKNDDCELENLSSEDEYYKQQ